MGEQKVLALKDLPKGAKKTIKLSNATGPGLNLTLEETEVLLINDEGTVLAVQAKCPHAGAPLEKGAICNGHLVCPWHMGTFALPGGELVEPPPLEGLKTYRVRVSGEDIFVDSEPIKPAPQEKSANDPRTFVLIGSGAAGTMAAVTLRREGFAGRILSIDPVTNEPVDRTQLSKNALAGKLPIEKLAIHLPQEIKIERVTASLTRLNAAHKEAELSDGQKITFDAALLATGGTPKRLDVPGAEAAYVLRHANDLKMLLEAAEKCKTAVIVGTSFIGLEAASALTQKKLRVTVVGPDLLPFAKKFGEPVAKTLKAFHESKGTHFHLGVEITDLGDHGVTIQSKASPQDTGIVPAELVVLGVGVTPELTFAHDLKVAEQGGIAVGADLRAAESVWVAGDIASVDGTRIEHWRLAEQHGQLAARQMLGRKRTYDSVPFFWTFHYDKRLGYLGHADSWDEIAYDGSLEALTFMAYYLNDGKVAAILSCGRDTETAMLAEVMKAQPTLAEARKAITTNSSSFLL